LLEALGQQRELALAADEARAADLALCVADEPVGGVPLDLDAQRLELEVTAERDGGARADHDVTRIGVRCE